MEVLREGRGTAREKKEKAWKGLERLGVRAQKKKGTLVLFMKSSFSAFCNSFQKELRPGERTLRHPGEDAVEELLAEDLSKFYFKRRLPRLRFLILWFFRGTEGGCRGRDLGSSSG